ncbi:NAD(P)H-dependent oxidoreductase [Lactobacillus alvi]|uniref:NAD(P)H-dependent oxidoreductase n=1 Tax=Limosilactobacillus alvi TaxID=990412 RepID=A0ABS2EQ44_9LACO|nr:NAD(P)H-dependent oxidoreductase [Limosilactobacillus alvi]MBM6754624.1 NAD(P)H-dependent oxidoreductase [Limosilactobacillus alvi]
MKLVGIVGSIAEESYNRKLMMFIANRFNNLADIEILSLKDVPMFSEDNDQTNSMAVQYLKHRIEGADGVIMVTPEHNHTTTAVLKSTIEWLSYKIHPLKDKPVLILGASYFTQGSSRAQLDLREILEAPGVNALVMPGNEFLLGNVRDAFDEDDNLKDGRTVKFLGDILGQFTKWVSVLKALKGPEAPDAWKNEDLTASGKTDTTIEGVDMDDPKWVEKASEIKHAASGKDYVKLDSGVLTVDQINWLLKSIPAELTYVDDNNQFIYYNHKNPDTKMFAKRRPDQTGNPLSMVHPDVRNVFDHVKQVVHTLRTGKTDMFQLAEPVDRKNIKWVVNNYQAIRDEDGNYRGINEIVLDFWPIVQKYLEMTGQKLVDDPNNKVDTGASASVKEDDQPAKAAPAQPAADTGASASVSDDASASQPAPTQTPTQPATPTADTGASASVEADDAPMPEVDTTASVSVSDK